MNIYTSTKVTPYVYKLTHKETGQFYIGFRCANKVPSDQDLGTIYQSSSNYVKVLGFDNFYQEILAEFFDKEAAYDFENRLIEENLNDYLILNKHYTKNGKCKFLGTSHSKEAREKMSSSHKGKTLSKESIMKRSATVTGSSKAPHTEETKLKISKTLTGRPGTPHTEEMKRQISKSSIGKILSPETKLKLLVANKGYIHTNETKLKMSLNSHKSKIIIVNNIEYVSIAEAARSLKLTRYEVKKLINYWDLEKDHNRK